MVYDKILEFDIWSQFGSFNKPDSNQGGLLTYFIPPKTSIIGIIGAVLGYKFDDYELDEQNRKVFAIEKFNDIKISIQPLFPFKVKRVTFNNLVSSTKIINIKQDVLIKPYYKVYVSFPDNLEEDERLFEENIKLNKSFFNLYMGRNEFLLNIKFCDSYENVNCFELNNDNSIDFFNDSNEIHGSLNRKDVIKANLSKTIKSSRSLFSADNSFDLESYYEYLITDYPVKREQFVQFSYSPISFYSSPKEENCYFSDILLKENKSLKLYNIGGKKWISLI